LAWVAAYPDDVVTLVAHEPPVFGPLPDAEVAARAYDRVRETYEERGWGAGMAAFVGMTTWAGEFTAEFLAQPLPDPASFGMPIGDDGRRDDPLLSARSLPVVRYRVDLDALAAAPTRIVLAVGEESAGVFPGRVAVALAARLGQEPVVFPGGHGGFSAEDGPWPGHATAFAERLRAVL
jgi:hypothetical protein